MRFTIRRATPDDIGAVYDVCLRTADAGSDATNLYADPALPGHVWAGSYLTLEPSLAFVLVDGNDVAGYVLGALDTSDFERRCEERWWPVLRRRYDDPAAVPRSQRTPDQHAARLIHHPVATPVSIVERFPSHLHIDLLPHAQSGGHGRRLLDTVQTAMRDLGSAAVHLGVSPDNVRAIGFYRHLGWETVDDFGEHGLVLGRLLS